LFFLVGLEFDLSTLNRLWNLITKLLSLTYSFSTNTAFTPIYFLNMTDMFTLTVPSAWSFLPPCLHRCLLHFLRDLAQMVLGSGFNLLKTATHCSCSPSLVLDPETLIEIFFHGTYHLLTYYITYELLLSSASVKL
jgi:hypothetical protein